MDAYWVLSGPAFPCGARKLSEDTMGPPPRPGVVWLDVCLMGQHLPQMYRETEIRVLTAADCPDLGLCPDCLGFGDAGVPQSFAAALRHSDEVDRPCPGCGGSGRPALRITIRRDGDSVAGEIRPVPHRYVPVRPPDDKQLLAFAAFEIPDGMCLACGMPEDGTGPHGQQLHPAGSGG